MTQGTGTDGAWLGLAGQTCVVTGAGSGIGAETARLFAAVGARVAILDRNPGPAATVADEIRRQGGQAIGLEADVGKPEMVAAAAERVRSELGPCRVLVNNAAIRHRDTMVDIGLDDWNKVLGVNLTGALLCAQVFARQMIAAGQGGSIVHVASLIGQHPHVGSGAYSVSKAGLSMLSKVLAVELGQHGIRSNVVSPGHTRTPATEAAYQDPETLAAREGLIPLGRIGAPADLAQVIVFVSSPRAGYLDAQDIMVDGGFTSSLMKTVPTPGTLFRKPAP